MSGWAKSYEMELDKMSTKHVRIKKKYAKSFLFRQCAKKYNSDVIIKVKQKISIY